MGVKRLSTASLQCLCVIPEIDIWRAATLMLKRYGDKALEQSRTRIDELASDGDHDGAGSQLPLSSLPARHHPDRCTNRNDPDTVA